MSVSLETTAFQNSEGAISIAFGVANHSDESIRIGSSMSQLYEVVASSATVDFYGDSHGYMAAPHHITVPAGMSKVFIRTYRQTHPAEELEHLNREDIMFEVLNEMVFETVTIEVEVLIRTEGINNLTEEIQIVPSELSVRNESDVVESLTDLPQTDNEIQMG